MQELTVLIVAAGSGSRLNSSVPKPYIVIGGKPLLWYSVNIFNKQDFVDKIFVVISENMQNKAKSISRDFFKNINKFAGFIIGGRSRRESVYKGLFKLNNYKKDGFVAIHDAARPFIPQTVLKNTFITALSVGGSAPALGVIDTIKQKDSENYIINHLERKTLVAIQTPQIFDFVKLWQIYKSIDIESTEFTDDTKVFCINHRVKTVKGSTDLFKITYKEDLERAKKICENYKD